MMATAQTHRRAKSREDIQTLVNLCKAGKLFDVQKWIASGKPVNSPPLQEGRQRFKAPLETAIDLGFHSLVQVLLEAGASIESVRYYCPMNQALEQRRFDIVKLLVEHGFDPKSVDMGDVFASWDSEIMRYFIDRGADVETGNPLARAFCWRIRTALGIFKQYKDRFPSFQEQANIALRYHCKEGNLKWVSLMLWAGADPYALGDADYDSEFDPVHGLSALGYAALFDHWDIFKLKAIKLDPDNPASKDLIRYASEGEGLSILMNLLKKGYDPNDQENGGCSTIKDLVTRMEWTFGTYRTWSSWGRENKGIDTHRSRDLMKAIHLLVKHGAHWVPESRDEINSMRRTFIKMNPNYTAEFVWVMWKYNGCSRDVIVNLLRTPRIKSQTESVSERIDELISSWPEDDAVQDHDVS